MPIYRPTRSQIILDLGLFGLGSLTVMERAIFTKMVHEQPADSRACAVFAVAEIRCYSKGPTGAYEVDASPLIPPRRVEIVGSNDTLLDAITFEEIAQRDVAGGETPAEFEARCELLPGATILQGDGFNVERDQIGGNVRELLLAHMEVAAAKGRYLRRLG